jgi:CysZ protein
MTPPTDPGFVHGIKTVPRAVRLLLQAPKILAWLLPPFLITLLLDGLAFYFAFGRLEAWVGELLPGGGLFAWLRAFLDILAGFLVFFGLAWTFTWVFLLLTNPFQDYISAAVEEQLKGQAGEEPPGFAGFLRSTWFSIVQAIWLTLAQLAFLLVALIPVVGPVLFFVFNAGVFGYSFFSIPAGRMAHTLKERREVTRRHLRPVMGLGLIITLAELIPFAGVLLLPVFVVAGTILFLDVEERRPGAKG